MEESSPSSASSVVCSSRCKKRKVDQIVVDAAADRISKLPDMVLKHIISFLSITDAVKTSVLSKRFDNMWTSVRKLHFYYDEYVKRDLFMNFVERVLTHRDFSSLRKFTLDCVVSSDVVRINTWISAAIRRNVQVLRLTLLHIKASLVLPHCLFSSNSLQELYLYMFHVLALPTSICFSSLRKLTLILVTFPNDHLTQQLFSGCPALEELGIYECNWLNLTAVSISSPSLKRLSISERTEVDGGCQIMILATSLEFFKCKNGFRNDYFLPYTSSVVSTSLVIRNDIEPGRIREVAYRIHKHLKVLQNITKLELASRVVEVFSSAKELFVHVPVFNCLTHLTLKVSPMGLDLEGLHKILQNSPHLESLNFAGSVTLTSGSLENDDQIFNPSPSCFTSHLKTIRVGDFTGQEDEIGAVKILLAHAAVLEKLVIGLHRFKDTLPLEKVRERLLLLPRISACSIDVVKDKEFSSGDC